MTKTVEQRLYEVLVEITHYARDCEMERFANPDEAVALLDYAEGEIRECLKLLREERLNAHTEKAIHQEA